jgi:hypothetical protein
VLASPTVAALPLALLGWDDDALALPLPPQPETTSAAMAAAAKPMGIKDLLRVMAAPRLSAPGCSACVAVPAAAVSSGSRRRWVQSYPSLG